MHFVIATAAAAVCFACSRPFTPRSASRFGSTRAQSTRRRRARVIFIAIVVVMRIMLQAQDFAGLFYCRGQCTGSGSRTGGAVSQVTTAAITTTVTKTIAVIVVVVSVV